MQPIYFRGRPFSARKSFFEGTHRIQSPEQTWKQIAPLAPLIGVTRVANITGLDKIGIPVTISIRPGAYTLSTSSGKGLSLLAAQVSGLMESLEIFCAETASPAVLSFSYNELIKKHKAPSLTHLSYRPHSLFHPDLPEKWVLAWDLFGQEELAVPQQSITQDYRTRKHENFEFFSFRVDTNGLASGCHFLEAVASGIYELIERDAVSCHLALKEHSHQPLKRIRLDTIRFQSVLETLQKIERAGVQAILYDCTVDTEVPVFKASIYEKQVRHSTGVCEGYGAHLDPEVAMIRALTEAVQGRAIVISGSRDDIFMSQYDAMKKNDTAEVIQTIESNLASIDASSYASSASATLEEDIHILMGKLRNAGLSQLLVYDLSQENLKMSVVRVIIPGLEGYYSRNFAPGLRVKKFISEAATSTREISKDQREGSHFPAGAIL